MISRKNISASVVKRYYNTSTSIDQVNVFEGQAEHWEEKEKEERGESK